MDRSWFSCTNVSKLLFFDLGQCGVLCQNSDQVQLGVTADSELASSCVDFFFLFFLFRSRASKQRRSEGDGARPLPAASRPRDTLCRLQRRLLRVAPWTARRSRRCHCAMGGITSLAGRTLPPGSNGSAPVAMRREGRGGGGEGGRCTARSPARTRTLISRRARGGLARLLTLPRAAESAGAQAPPARAWRSKCGCALGYVRCSARPLHHPPFPPAAWPLARSRWIPAAACALRAM